MSLFNSFDRNQHLGELNSPLFTGNPVPVSPAQRKRLAQINLGLTSGALLQTGIVPAAVNVSATLTPAQLFAGIITSSTAAAVVATLPLGATLEAAWAAQFGSLGVNDSFTLDVVNTGGANAFTMTTNTGWTLVGTMAVALSSSGTFRIVRTGVGLYTIYRIS